MNILKEHKNKNTKGILEAIELLYIKLW